MSVKFSFIQSGSSFGKPVAGVVPVLGPQGPQGQSGMASGRLFYFNYSNTGSDSGYSQLSQYPTSSSGSIVSTTIGPMLYDVLYPPFITDINVPDAEIIPSGIWSINLFASCTGSIRVFADIITYHYTGDSEVISTTPEVVVNSSTPTMYTLQSVVPYQNIHRDDRFGITLRCLNDTLQFQTLHLHYEGNYYSYLNTPLSSFDNGPTGPAGIMGPSTPEWTIAQTSTFTGGCITHLDHNNVWNGTGPTDIWEINNFDRFGNNQRQLFEDIRSALTQSSSLYFSLSNTNYIPPVYYDDIAQYKLLDIYQGTAAYYIAGEFLDVSGSQYIGTGSNIRFHWYSLGMTGATGPRGIVGALGATGAVGPQGDTGKGFQIFSSVNSYNQLCSSNPSDSNIGEFVLITGGELFLYMGTGLGQTGPTGCANSWNYAGDITDDTKLIGTTGAQGPQGPGVSVTGNNYEIQYALTGGLSSNTNLSYNVVSSTLKSYDLELATDAIHLGNGTLKSNYSVGIGVECNRNAGTYNVSLGYRAGFSGAFTNSNSISIGSYAGSQTQLDNSISIGNRAGQVIQSSNSVSIGTEAGQYSQQSFAVAMGYNSGRTNQQGSSVAIGNNTASNNQQPLSVAIGYFAAYTTQGQSSIAIGPNAAQTNQSNYGIAMGYYSGNTNQSNYSISMGFNSGQTNQGSGPTSGTSGNAISIGRNSGQTNQGFSSIAIGNNSAQNNQGRNSVAIGVNSGQNNQGTYCIAIGNNSGVTNQPDNSIIINASNTVTLNASSGNGLYINPIRYNSVNTQNILSYNPSTYEITYFTGGAMGPQGAQGIAGSDGTNGSTGPQGAVGATGTAGPTGAAGTSGSSVWFSTGTSAIFYTGALVGIRTSTPQTALDVNGDITCRGQVINPIFKGYKETINIATSTGTFDINWGTGNNHSVTLQGGSNTITFSGIAATGTLHSINVFFQQPATSATITWPTSVSWGAVGAPVLSTTANAVDIINFVSFKGTSRVYGFLAGKGFTA